MQIGGGILIGRFFQWFLFSETVISIGIIFALIGISLIFYDKKGLSFFDFTGFLGDWLSYARILALALATSGIAMTDRDDTCVFSFCRRTTLQFCFGGTGIVCTFSKAPLCGVLFKIL